MIDQYTITDLVGEIIVRGVLIGCGLGLVAGAALAVSAWLLWRMFQ